MNSSISEILMLSLSLYIFTFLFDAGACKSYWCLIDNIVILCSCVIVTWKCSRLWETGIQRTCRYNRIRLWKFTSNLCIWYSLEILNVKFLPKDPLFLTVSFARQMRFWHGELPCAVCTYVGLCVLSLKMHHYWFSFLELLVSFITF